jgi:hypothetical protein
LPVVLALAAAAIALPALVDAGCSTQAVGVDECRTIESARCAAARSCGFSEDQATACTEFYRDQCLHGIENSDDAPTEAQASACVKAVQAVEACVKVGAKHLADCPAVPVATGVDPAGLGTCQAILSRVELLAACSFVAKTINTSGSTTTTSGAGGAGGSDAGNDANDDASGGAGGAGGN